MTLPKERNYHSALRQYPEYTTLIDNLSRASRVNPYVLMEVASRANKSGYTNPSITEVLSATLDDVDFESLSPQEKENLLEVTDMSFLLLAYLNETLGDVVNEPNSASTLQFISCAIKVLYFGG